MRFFCVLFRLFNVKRYQHLFFLWFSGIIIGLYGCASTGNPTGGPKDILPPKLDSLTSSVGQQLRFKPKKLVFNFDEFVEVKDPLKQVLVSPPLTYIPQVKAKGKRVTFAFDEKEVFREEATYTINFGESIVDFREGNKLNNFTFVFSTGDFLDSLNIKGRILNAQTNEPEPEMVVFLYDKLKDTIVRKEKPFYFAKPDKEGFFEFKNIKSDTFRIFAIKDENLNYKYDLETEKIAFLDSLIILTDTLGKNITMRASLPVPKFKIRSTDTKSYGKIKVQFNAPPDPALAYKLSDNSITHLKEISGDTLNIYYKSSLDSFFVYLLDDTIKVKPKGEADFLKKSKFKKVATNQGNVMLPSDSLLISFNFPIEDINPENIVLYDTIGILTEVKYSYTADRKGLIMKYPWVAGEKYVLEIDSGYVKSFFGQALDSIGHTFTILTKDKTANLLVNITELDSTQNYLVRILKEKVFITSITVSETSKYDLVLKGLLPDKYNVEIIEDTNNNGRWDAGDYNTGRQPEAYLLTKGEKLRENRDTELPIAFKKGLIPVKSADGKVGGLQNSTNKLQNK